MMDLLDGNDGGMTFHGMIISGLGIILSPYKLCKILENHTI